MLSPDDFFDLSDDLTRSFFAGCHFVWEALAQLGDRVVALTGSGQNIQGQVMPGAFLGDRPLFIAAGAIIEPGAYVQGPAYIGAGVIVRHGALVRENVALLAGSQVGHATEVKHSLFLPGAHAPHFNYVGDSILGHRVNLGAGTKLSNLALTSDKDASGRRPTIVIHVDQAAYDTHLTKLGAILGDEAQTGCNAVLNPGCLIGRRTLVYANMSVRKGYFPPDTVLKLRQKSQVSPRR